MKYLKLFTIVLAFVLALSITAFGQTITSTTTGGNWNVGGTWVGGVVPGASNDVIIADGATVTINANITVASLTVGQGTSGILTFDGVAARAVTVTGNVTIAAGGTFITQATGTFTNTLSIGGELTNNGTFDMSRAGTTLLCNVTFNKNGDQTITGTTPVLTRFRGVTLDKTSVSNKVICNINVSIAGSNLFVFTAGTWEQTANTLFITSGSQTIAATGVLNIIGSANFDMAIAGSLTINGTLTVNTSGYFSMGSGNNSLIPAVATAVVNFTAGTVNIYGRLTLTAGTTTINGANIFIDPQHTNSLANSSNCIEVAAAANFTFSSGSVTIVDPLVAPAGTGREIRFRLATTGVHTISGGTIYLGDGISTTAGAGYRISIDAGEPALNNLVIQTGSAAERAPTLSTNNTLINGTLTMISGVFTGTNIFNYGGAGTLVYAGSTAQTTSSVEFPATTSPNNLTINNSSGVNLHASRTVNGTLALTSGRLTLGSNNLTLGASATISGQSLTNYIVTDGTGFLTRNVGATNVLFPVGTASTYNPVTINNAGTADNFSVRVKSTFDNPPVDPSTVVNRQWTIDEAVAGGSNATLTFQWNGADEASGFDRSAGIEIGRYTGTQWVGHGAVYNGGSDPYSASVGGITEFSNFSVGNSGALPVQLASFVGYFVNSNDVTFEWETISEINNFGFWIQSRNIHTNEFTTIEESFQPAKNVPSTYTWTYKNAITDNTEFYLLQQDNNGLETKFGPFMLNPNNVPVEAVPAVFALHQNYPNPFNPSTVISWQLPVGGYTTLKVYNLMGTEVATLLNGYVPAGKHQVKFDASHLASGIYIYKLQSGNNVEVRKLILLR